MIDWHRLFGLTLMDFFADSPYVVELETDLSLRQQLLDVVILRRQTGDFVGPLPDGLENLATYNLLTYKSLREPLDDWALKELTGHYVNYRKQSSAQALLPEEAFRLYAVSTRFPEKLARQVRFERLRAGVYEVVRGTDQIRVLVLREIPEAEHNAIWNLFSGVHERVAYGAQHYERHTRDMSTILSQLFEQYQVEGLEMPYTLEDFRRDFTREHVDLLTPDERLEGLSLDEVLRRFSPDQLLERLSLDEVLERLSLEELQAYLAKRRRDREDG
jgi:hypothetical protein